MAKNEARLELTAVDNATRVIKGVQTSVSGLASSWKLLGAAVVTGFAGSFLTDAIKMRSALDDLADTTGDNVKTLDGFRRVLQVAGVELDAGGAALAKFAKNLNAADDDGKAASEAIGAIGLDLKALQALKPAEAMLEVAKALGKFEDGASKVGVAMALFGKEGARLLPVLKDLAEEGGYAGKITAEQAAQAEALEKSWRRLGIAFDDGKQALASGIIPALVQLVDQMREGIKIAGGFGQALLIFGTQNPFKTAAEQANAAREAIDNLVKGRENLARLPGYDAALKQIDEQIAIERKRLEFSNFRARQEALAGRTGPQFLDARDLRAQQKETLNFKGAADKPKSAGADPGKELINQLETEIAKTQGLTREEEILLLLQTERYAKVTAAQRERIVALAKESDEAKVQVELGKLRLELDRQEVENQGKAATANANYQRSVREANAAAAEQIAQRVDPTRALYQEIQKIADLVKAGALDPEVGDARLQAINREIDAMNKYGTEIDKNADLAKGFSLALTSGFSKAITEGGKLRDVLKGIGQDILQIVTKKTVLDPIEKEIGGLFKGGLGGLFKGLGGSGGSSGGGFLDELFVGSFATGTRFVPRTGLALLHQGEAVIPAEQNARGGGGNVYHIDARGADMAAIARLERSLVALAGPGVVERRAVSAVSEARRR